MDRIFCSALQILRLPPYRGGIGEKFLKSLDPKSGVLNKRGYTILELHVDISVEHTYSANLTLALHSDISIEKTECYQSL